MAPCAKTRLPKWWTYKSRQHANVNPACLLKPLDPQSPKEIQIAAIRSLSQHRDAKVGKVLLNHWGEFTPLVRQEALAALLARKERVFVLLEAIRNQTIPTAHVDAAKIALLRKYPDPEVQQLAKKLFQKVSNKSRLKIIAQYQKALDMKPDPKAGKVVFKKICANCHRLEKVGFETGPELAAVLTNKTPDTVLEDILDPNREVDPRYLEYVVQTKSGNVITGRIVTETATSITLRRAQNQEDVILRKQIDVLQATTRSLMPEGLEKRLSVREMADLIGYLQAVVRNQKN